MLLELARKSNWEVVAEKGSVVIERGPEIIEIEIGSGGIPRTVRRTHPDGSREVIRQNYIRMIDVLDWINAPAEEQKSEEVEDQEARPDADGARGDSD